MAEFVSRTTIRTPVFKCPACGEDVVANVAVELRPMSSLTGKEVTLQGNIIGLRISHGCAPELERSPHLDVQPCSADKPPFEVRG